VSGLALAAALPASAECTFGKKCTDLEAVELIEAQIATTCDCAGADKPKTYKKCVKGLVKDAVRAGTLPKGCKGGVVKCEAKSTCGRPGSIACCAVKKNGKVKATIAKSADKCRADACVGHVRAGDACDPEGGCAPLVRPFKNVQQVFTESCALSGCHNANSHEGNLVLNEEELSYSSLVDVDAFHEDAPEGLKRVVPGDSANSFLIQKLRGGAGLAGAQMPQGFPALDDAIIDMIAGWIDRGAKPTEEECGAIEVQTISTAAGRTQVVTAKHSTDGDPLCDDRPIISGNFEWKPEPPLPAPPANEGVQLFAPRKDIPSGTEWESCVAVKLDLAQIRANLGLGDKDPLVIKDQLYRMHTGSHHLLIYNYLGQNPDDFPEGHFPCAAGTCEGEDCPPDPWNTLPIGGTQVAGTRYEVTYPTGVGVPLFGPVVILNMHYTNPFTPAQDTYGEAWVNLDFYGPGGFKVLLDGIFAINASFVVEPFETLTTSRIWQPRGLISRQPTDGAVFQLFGHMHKRGTRFIIDRVGGGQCSGAGGVCERNADCSGRQQCIDGTCQQVCGRDGDCPGEQTCVIGPNHTDVPIYDTRSWDHAPVTDFPPPYVRVDKEEGLRWTCVHSNGILGEGGEEIMAPKRCHEACEACGWDDADRKCHFRDGRVFDEGVPMPLVFGALADDDMCNMFGYFVNADDLSKIQP